MTQPNQATAPRPDTRPASSETGIREDLLHPDPLLDCLVELTRIHGRPSTRAALSAGLPLPKEGLTPSLFSRAAAHAGFSSKVVRRSLRKIDPALLPVILLLKGNEACVLQGFDEDGQARLLLPDGAQGGVYMPRAELEERYTGIAIFSRPHFRFDERTPPLVEVPQRHWFWGTILEQRPIFKDILASALLINLFGLAMPLFTMNVYDRVVPNFAVETLWVFAGGIVIVLLMDYMSRLLRGHFVDMASSRVDLKLSSLIMERVLGMRMAHRPASVGAFAANLRSFETVRDFIASATVTTLIDLPFALVFLLVLAWISWPLVFIPLLGMVIVIIYSYLIQYKMRELSETTFRAAALRNATMIESLTALETIKAHGTESQMQERWEKSTAFLARVSAELKLLSSSSMNAASTLAQFVNVCVVVAGVYLIHEKMLSMGGLIAATMLSGRAMQPLGQMVGLLLQFEGAKNSLTALENVMATPSERSDESAFVHRPEIRGEIEFSNVHFSYPDRPEEALRGVSFRIRPGEKVVIIGRIGSGKSTLQKLMLGLYAPTKGAVALDGVDLRQLDPADLRRSIGYVEQDSVLFYGSLRDNIAIRAPYADDRAVVAAAELAGLTDYVNRHPEGFDMVVRERGESLSGGQRQSVAIARAVLLDPPVLLLDEPTSSMDHPSESAFKERIRAYANHKTMIIVTHRSSLMELADRIIVMDDGMVVADGPKEKVIAALQSGQVGEGKMIARAKRWGMAILRLLEAIRVRVDKGTAHWLTRWKDSSTLTGETDFMHDADSIIIRQEPLRARVLGYSLTGAVLLFVLWAALVQVDEITRGDAKVIPSRQLQVLQSLDGGIVSQILVTEGQMVAEGQVLLQVDSTRFESSVRENRSQYLSLLARAARLRAVGEGKPFVPPPEAVLEDPRTVEEERRLYETASSELQTQLSIARQQLAQRSQELNEATAKQRQAAQAFESTSRELAVTKPLLSSGAVSEVELLRLERDVSRFRGERDIAASQIARVQAAISESSRKVQEVELSFRNIASKEYSETMAKLNSLAQSGTGLADRVKQSALRSPVKGTIKRLLVNTVGGVVQPGRDVVEIVPLEGRLLLEAKVAPRDIAFLKPGQRAIVKFSAYDFSVYGGLTASLEHIGADSVTDDRGNTFYTVRVATDKTTLAGGLPIIPGMVAEVDIITGKKTILSYLLKPVLRAKASALTER